MAEAEYLPLNFYPATTDLRALKRVFDEARLGVKVQPIVANKFTIGRIVCFGEPFPYLREYVYVEDIDSPDCVEAIKWVLGLENNAEPVTVLRQLERVFGAGVKEITE